MYLSKSLLGTLFVSAIWTVAAFFILVFGLSELVWGIATGLLALATTYFTLRVIVRVDEKHEASPSQATTHPTRVERWLNSLDDDELDALRERLSSPPDSRPYESVGDLLEQQKRKR